MSFSASPEFSSSTATTATTTIATLAAGATQDLSITLQVDDDFSGTILTNTAEITSADNALDLPDQDDALDGNNNI